MNAKELDERIIEKLTLDVKTAQCILENYESSPNCCRMANDYFIRSTVGSASPSDLGMKQTGRYKWSCPTCNRCVLDES